MLTRAASQDIRSLEALGSFNFHRPFITAPRTGNSDSPLTAPFAQRVFNQSDDFRPPGEIARILQFDDYCHDECYCNERNEEHGLRHSVIGS